MGNWVLPHVQTTHYEFTTPTEEGVEHIANNLRISDREEVFACMGNSRYHDAIKLSMVGADDTVMAVNAYSEPVALLGVSTTSVLYKTGCPWMLCTPQARQHKRAFIELAGFYTLAMLNEYSSLENYVDVRNITSIAWLKHIGFVMGEPEPYGALGMPFYPFRIERPALCATQMS